MMGADYTQWHGIWDLQKDLVEIIRYAAEHGLPEGEAWMVSDDPAKFWLYHFTTSPVRRGASTPSPIVWAMTGPPKSG